jgi:peptide/nickel transport system substrate-binding protein
MLEATRLGRFTRTTFLRQSAALLAALGGGALLSACGSSPGTPTAVPPAAAPTQASAPASTSTPAAATVAATPAPAAQAATATVTPTSQAAVANLASSQNPVLRVGSAIPVLSGIFPAGFASQERTMLSNVFLPPLVRDDQNALHPGLLTSYTPNADGSAWTLKVDPNAKWSDGSKLTAQDVMTGWAMSAAPVPSGVQLQKFSQFVATGMETIVGYKDVAAGKAKEMSGVTVTDPETLRVQLTQADPIFSQRLALPVMGVMKADQWAQDPFIFQKPTCLFNGPYKTVSYDQQAQSYAFEPNPNWWGTKPTIQRVELKAKVDESTLFALWQNNQIDVGFWTGDVLKQLFANDAKLISRLPYPGIGMGILFNVTKDPVSDINVRKAMAHGADYNNIVSSVMGDTQRPALGVIPPDLPCYDKRTSTYKFDVAMAKSFLAQSKYGSAATVPKMQFGNSIKAPWPELQAVIEQWRTNLGLRVDFVTDTSFLGKADAAQYDVVRFSIGSIIPDTVTFLESALNPSDGTFKYQSHYDSPKIRDLLAQAGKLFPTDANRCVLANQAQQVYLDDYAGIPIERVTYEYWVKPWVNGWKNNIDLSPYTIPEMSIAQH